MKVYHVYYLPMGPETPADRRERVGTYCGDEARAEGHAAEMRARGEWALVVAE